MYLTYVEYAQYGGTLDEPTFSSLLFRVSKILDRATANRISKMETVPEAVKRCLVELISLEYIFSKNETDLLNSDTGRVVASVSTDGYSETYASVTGDTGTYLASNRKQITIAETRVIQEYLQYIYDDENVPLLYRGVR